MGLARRAASVVGKALHGASLAIGSPPTALPPPGDSLFKLINEFQTGSCHMAFVAHDPAAARQAISMGQPPQGRGSAIGIITLEDIIEEILTGPRQHCAAMAPLSCPISTSVAVFSPFRRRDRGRGRRAGQGCLCCRRAVRTKGRPAHQRRRDADLRRTHPRKNHRRVAQLRRGFRKKP